VKLIEASHGFRIGDRPNQWRLEHALAGGGALMDVGIYALQSARYVSDEDPIEISATETKTDSAKFKEVDESISWSMRFPSGVLANCVASYFGSGMNRLWAGAESGWFQLEPAYSYDGLKGRSSETEFDLPQPDQFATEMDDFASCILSGRKSKASGEEGLRDMKIITAIYQSIRVGRTVKL
jgi:predicted dehydrogenase